MIDSSLEALVSNAFGHRGDVGMIRTGIAELEAFEDVVSEPIGIDSDLPYLVEEHLVGGFAEFDEVLDRVSIGKGLDQKGLAARDEDEIATAGFFGDGSLQIERDAGEVDVLVADEEGGTSV